MKKVEKVDIESKLYMDSGYEIRRISDLSGALLIGFKPVNDEKTEIISGIMGKCAKTDLMMLGEAMATLLSELEESYDITGLTDIFIEGYDHKLLEIARWRLSEGVAEVSRNEEKADEIEQILKTMEKAIEKAVMTCAKANGEDKEK